MTEITEEETWTMEGTEEITEKEIAWGTEVIETETTQTETEIEAEISGEETKKETDSETMTETAEE